MINFPIEDKTRPTTERWRIATSDQLRIIFAVVLQDMKTRFGGSYTTYLLALLWPFSHLITIVVAFILTFKVVPLGDDPTIFISTGALPYILCLYPARVMANALLQNRIFLALPIVTPLSLIIGRSIVETFTAFLVLIIYIGTLSLFGIEWQPPDSYTAATAVVASVYLGVCLGIFNAVAGMLTGHFYVIFVVLIMLLCYLFSGIYGAELLLREPIINYVYWNPLFQLVQWLRSSYYVASDVVAINHYVVIGEATIFLMLGLAGERFIRGIIK